MNEKDRVNGGETENGKAENAEFSAEITAHGEDTVPESSGADTKKRTRAIIIAAAAAIAVIAVCVLGIAVHYLGMIDFTKSSDEEIPVTAEYLIDDSAKSEELIDYEKLMREELESNAEELVFTDDVINILLIGTDNRGDSDKSSRTDAMLVVSVNKSTKQVTVTSMMRDIYVWIPGAWTNRLNTAYPIGGAELLMKTLRESFSMPVDKYVVVDFYSFADAIDAIGGIDVDVSEKELVGMRDYYVEMNALFNDPQGTDVIETDKAGMINLNGKQALIYARIRNTGGGDFERTYRQRKIINAVLDKVKDSTLIQLNDVAEAILPNIKTNLSVGEIASLMLNAKDYLKYDIRSLRIPVDGEWWYETIDEMEVVCINMKPNKDTWYNCVYLGVDIPEGKY